MTAPRSVFLTGTSTGLGRAAVALFSERGWQVVATMRELWREYADCAGPQCRRDLPSGLRADPVDNAGLTAAFWAQVRQRAAATLTR